MSDEQAHRDAYLEGAVKTLQQAADDLERKPGMDAVVYLRELADQIDYLAPEALT